MSVIYFTMSLLGSSIGLSFHNIKVLPLHLGVTFDCTMSLERHVTNISWAAYCIGRIRRYLIHEHTKQLVHALVISCIDCCNSLLNGLSATLIAKLQRVQKACARVIMIRSKCDHATPMLLELHWLPIKNVSLSKPYFSLSNAFTDSHLYTYLFKVALKHSFS